MYRKSKNKTRYFVKNKHGGTSVRCLLAVVLVLFMVGIMIPTNVNADPATSITSDYVKVFTTQGKPVWAKLTLPSGGVSASLTPGSSVSFRLDYCFDGAPAQKPAAGDSLQLWASGFPNGTFLLPSNMHTSGNMYRNGVITLNFADVGGYTLATGVNGWMTVTFMASGDGVPGTYSPQIVGNGSAGNIILVDHLSILEPGTAPGPSGPPSPSYTFARKLAEHVLYPDGSGGYIMQTYQYQVPIAPAYISYEFLSQEGGGLIWVDGHIKEFDYVTITDTLGPGQEFAQAGFPETNIWYAGPVQYDGTEPVYGITISKHKEDGDVDFASQIDKTDAKVQMTVSEDRKTFTLKIEKGARISGTTETFDEYCQIRLDYYAKVTDPAEMTFYNNAKIEYVKNGQATSGDSSVRVDVIEGAGATFIFKEVIKDSGDLNGRGLHRYDDPLIVNPGDKLLYWINFTVTGDANLGELLAGNVILEDVLHDKLTFFQARLDHSKGFNPITYDSVSRTVTLVNSSNFGKDTYYGVFEVEVGDISPGEVIPNTIVQGGNTSVVKGDGYAIQVYKYDADDTTTGLTGAKFQLFVYNSGGYEPYKVAGSDVVLLTDSNGKTGIQNLPAGTYKLVEIQAPTGYLLELNNTEIEFEILPESSGFKGINKILVFSAPENVENPVDDEGVAVFTVYNDLESNPTGNLMIIKNLPEVLDTRQFYVTLTDGDGKYLTFDAVNSYEGLSVSAAPVEINETLPVLLENIPLSLGEITVAETNASKAGYNVAYSIGGTPGNIVHLTTNKQTVFMTVTNTVSDESEPIVFDPIDMRLSGTKTLTDANDVALPIDAGQFTFTLDITDDLDGGCTWNGSNHVDVSAGGSIDFGTLTFAKPGTYEIVISEDNLGFAHYGYDPGDVTITVVVSEYDDELIITSEDYSKDGDPVSGIVFNNTYIENAATQPLIGVKTLTNPLNNDAALAITEGLFTFELTGDTANPGAWTWNGHNPVSVHADGEINFGTLFFTDEGEYIFTVSEIKPISIPAGWSYDFDDVTIIITVEDENSGGQLAVTEVTYFKGGEEVNDISFANTHEIEERIVQGVSVPLTANKKANRDMTAGQFTFTLYKSDELGNQLEVLQTKTNESAGMDSLVEFAELTFNEADTYYCLLRETAGGTSTWRLDTTRYLIKIDVTDDGVSPDLSADVSYSRWNGSGWTTVDNLTFNNTYTVSDGGSTPRDPEQPVTPVVENKEPEKEDEDVELEEEQEEDEQTREEETILPERREQDQEQISRPGGDNPFVQPNPTLSGNRIEPGEDGIYLEIGEDGLALGEWRWDDETMEWIFEEYPTPLAFMPVTGDNAAIFYLILLAVLFLTGMTATVRLGKRVK